MQQNEKLKNEFQELQLQLARVVSIFIQGPNDRSQNIVDPWTKKSFSYWLKLRARKMLT